MDRIFTSLVYELPLFKPILLGNELGGFFTLPIFTKFTKQSPKMLAIFKLNCCKKFLNSENVITSKLMRTPSLHPGGCVAIII